MAGARYAKAPGPAIDRFWYTGKRQISWRFHMGTIIVGLVLAAIVGLAVRSMVKDKKAGKSIQCGGDCKHCGGGHCH